MRLTIAAAAAIVAWFVSFLVVFLCITVLNAVITGMAGINHMDVMAQAYTTYAGISGFISTFFVILYARDLNLIQSESMLDKDTDYSTDKIKNVDNSTWLK